MVLRSSPWESRTSLTNKGHFASRGGAFAARALQFEPSARSALFCFYSSFYNAVGSDPEGVAG